LELDDIVDQMELRDVYTIFCPITEKYTFLSEDNGPSSKIYYILGHKANIIKYKKMEIFPCILSNQNGIKLEINSKNTPQKIFKHMKSAQYTAE
jgi:hypothetical protein